MSRQRASVPERLRWAVDLVIARSPTTVLEIGCGRGIAIDLLCDACSTMREIVGLDRSETAIRAAATRNARHIAAGRVRLVNAEIADAPIGETRFDFVFAVNVNVFWVRSAAEELAAVERVLAPTGRLALVYEPPSARQVARIEAQCTRNFEESGMVTVDVLHQDLGGNAGVCILARPSSG
jgi:SAM-dependent methyltransferase